MGFVCAYLPRIDTIHLLKAQDPFISTHTDERKSERPRMQCNGRLDREIDELQENEVCKNEPDADERDIKGHKQ